MPRGRAQTFPASDTGQAGLSEIAVTLSACFDYQPAAGKKRPLNIIVEAGSLGADGKLVIARKTATLPIENFAGASVVHDD